MRLKKIGIMLVVAAMCVSVSACGNNNGNTNNAPTQGQAGTQAPAGYRSDVACADLEAAVAEQMGEDYLATMGVEEVEHLGLTSDMYTDFAYKMPMMMVNVDTMIIVKAADGKVEDVKKALEGYRNTLIEDTMQYPSNIVKIHNSVIKVYGNYVAFIQLGADHGNEASIEAASKNPNLSEDEISKIESDAILEQNERAAKIIESKLMAQ